LDFLRNQWPEFWQFLSAMEALKTKSTSLLPTSFCAPPPGKSRSSTSAEPSIFLGAVDKGAKCCDEAPEMKANHFFAEIESDLHL